MTAAGPMLRKVPAVISLTVVIIFWVAYLARTRIDADPGPRSDAPPRRTRLHAQQTD